MADAGGRQHDVLARCDGDLLTIQTRRVTSRLGCDRNAARRVAQIDGAQLVVQRAVDAQLRRPHFIHIQVGFLDGWVSEQLREQLIGLSPSRHAHRNISVLHRQTRQLLTGPATSCVNAVHRQTGGFGASVQRTNIGILGDVGAVVFDKATVGIHGHVEDAQVQGAAVLHQNFRIGTGHQTGTARDVVAVQLDVAAARTQILDVQEVGIHTRQGHVIGFTAFGVGLGKPFTNQGCKVKTQLGFDKGPDFGHVAIARQLVIQAGHIGTRAGTQVF